MSGFRLSSATSRSEPVSPVSPRSFSALGWARGSSSRLRQFQIGQYIREEGPKSHQKKAGTPTMGGVLIIISIVIPTLLWANLRYPYVWIALAALVGFGWIGFLDDYAKITTPPQPGPDRPPQTGLSIFPGLRLRRRAANHARLWAVLEQHERAFLQAIQAVMADPIADAQSVDVCPGRGALRDIGGADCSLHIKRRESHRRPGRPRNRADGDLGGRPHRTGVCRRPRSIGGLFAARAQPAYLGIDHLLRLHDGSQSGIPLVQRASGRDLHGRCRLARDWAAPWPW